MGEFKIGDWARTYKVGSKQLHHPEIGFEFKVLGESTIGTLYFKEGASIPASRCKLVRPVEFDQNPSTRGKEKEYTSVRASRCKLVHREEDKDQLRPDHYGGEDNPFEAIKVIEGLKLDFIEGNIVKYLFRYKKKNGLMDLKKSQWYLDRLIKNLENNEQ